MSFGELLSQGTQIIFYDETIQIYVCRSIGSHFVKDVWSAYWGLMMIGDPKRKVVFERSMFRCYVSSLEGTPGKLRSKF